MLSKTAHFRATEPTTPFVESALPTGPTDPHSPPAFVEPNPGPTLHTSALKLDVACISETSAPQGENTQEQEHDATLGGGADAKKPVAHTGTLGGVRQGE
jgi:hypothetical protein